jgi:hypothetical protein
MNRSEIHAMMRDLPSQQVQETLSEKVFVGIIFLAMVLGLMLAPNLMP